MLNFLFIFLLFFMYSVLGYILECIFCSIYDKKIVKNRGFLIGPYLPIYGTGSIIMIFLLKKYYNDPFILFIMSAFIASILEYATSYFMEIVFKARWWDYTNKKYNINGRVCLENSFLFGVAGLIIIYLINPLFLIMLNCFSNNLIVLLGIIFLLIFSIDIVLSIMIIYRLRGDMSTLLKDSTEEISEKVRDLLRKNRLLKKRLLNAFPQINKYNIYNKLKELVEKK